MKTIDFRRGKTLHEIDGYFQTWNMSELNHLARALASVEEKAPGRKVDRPNELADAMDILAETPVSKDLAKMDPSHANRVKNLIHLGARGDHQKREEILRCIDQLFQYSTRKLFVMAKMLEFQKLHSVQLLLALLRCEEGHYLEGQS